MKIELAHDVGAVSLRGLDTHAEHAGHFLGGLAFCQELYHFPLAGGQPVLRNFWQCGRRVATAEVAVQHDLRHLGGEEGPVTLQGFHGCDQIARSIGLEQEASGAGVENFAHHLLRLVDGENENRGSRFRAQDLAGSIETVQVRHADIQNHQIRLELCGLGYRIPAIDRLTADFPTFAGLKKGAQAMANDFVIIGNENA